MDDPDGTVSYQKHCPGCYVDKAGAPVCPYCGYDEAMPRSRLFLPHGIVLAGQYRVGKVLGRPGGFGITYLGWDVNLQQRVAIKEFLPRDICARAGDSLDVTVHTDQERNGFEFGKEQFLREARIVAQFDHPNIVRVRAFFKANDTAYLVMDYYEGLSLSDYLSNVRRIIAPEVAASLMLSVLEGLMYVHERGVMHRDVKPANIYLAAVGKPILLDFGAARQAAAGDLARSISVVLTEGYAPLEQYQRRTPQGPWTDVYGIAATFYRMITGQIPPAALDRLGTDPLLQGNYELVMPALRPIMARALAVKPQDRYQSAAEFHADLLAYRQQVDSRPSSPAASPAPPPPPSPSVRAAADSGPISQAETKPRIHPPTEIDRPRLPPLPPARAVALEEAPSPLPRQSPLAAERHDLETRVPEKPRSAATMKRQQAWRNAGSIAVATLITAAVGVGAVMSLLRDRSPPDVVSVPTLPARTAAVEAAPAEPLELPDLVALPGGEFSMGDDAGMPDERPAHRVSVRGFKLSVHEVTVAQFRQFVTQTRYDNPLWVNYPCESSGGRLPSWERPGYPQGEDFPVVCVSWADAQAYTDWLSRQTGQIFRLPTEAEWEYAARAGTRSAVWWGGNFEEGKANCAGCAPIRNAPAPVRSYPANPWGLYELNGNVREWTCSRYEPFAASQESRCAGDNPGSYVAVRGGSWQEPVDALRSAARLGFEPSRRNVWTGFRVAQQTGDAN